jgi:hypothetical protein
MIVHRFALSELPTLISIASSRFIRDGTRLHISDSPFFRVSPFSTLDCEATFEVLRDSSLSNVDLRTWEVPSFVGIETLNLLNTDSQGVGLVKRSNTDDRGVGSA